MITDTAKFATFKTAMDDFAGQLNARIAAGNDKQLVTLLARAHRSSAAFGAYVVRCSLTHVRAHKLSLSLCVCVCLCACARARVCVCVSVSVSLSPSVCERLPFQSCMINCE